MNSRITEHLSSLTKTILVCTAVVSASNSVPTFAAEKARTSGKDSVRDMNLFQVEPTVIDERHYTSGRAERHQKTSPTLPYGAPIPDNDSVATYEVKPTTTESQTKTEQKNQASTQTSAVDTTVPTSKLDTAVQTELNALKSGEDKTFKLKIKCSSSDDRVLKTLKEVKNLKIISIDKAQNEIIVEAGTSAVAQLSGLSTVTSISLANAGK
jgi:hypothetical protein